MFSNEMFDLGTEVVDLKPLKKVYPHLSDVNTDKIDFRNIKIRIGQDRFDLIHPVEYKTNEKNQPWAVRTPL